MLPISLSLYFNIHFPGGPGLAGTRMSTFWMLLELRLIEIVVTAAATRHAKLQSKCHHQQTNSQLLPNYKVNVTLSLIFVQMWN